MTAEGSTAPALGSEDPDNFFSLVDYGLFLGMLAISGLIGLYYGFLSKRKQNSPEEYILGSKEMSIIPISASLIVSNVSGISMLAVPADIYSNGTQYVMAFICHILAGFALVYVFLPVFYNLNCPSIFVYLERRFDRRVRVTASLVFALNSILALPIVIYVPALAFNKVSGINIHYITIVLCALCIFYTTIGGIRAVVWTDTIQYISIMGAFVAVIVVGTKFQGGIENIFEAAERGGRLTFFDMTLNPFVKSSFWTVTIGLSAMEFSFTCANQGTIQRFLTLPSKKKGTRCAIIFVIGMCLIKVTIVYIGILLYSKYEHCDPLAAGRIEKVDQILPHYVLNLFKNLPGLAGIFIAGICSGALSTMSSTLNTLAGSIFEDFIKPRFKNLGPRDSSVVMKVIVLSIGLLVLAFVFFVGKLGTIMHLSYSVNGWTAGVSLGIFVIGMFSRRANTKGIIAGAVVSLTLVGIILVGAQTSVRPPPLPFNNDQCEAPEIAINAHRKWIEQLVAYDNVPLLFRVSFMYYTLIGAFVLILVAYPVSIITGGCEDVDEQLLAPIMRTRDYTVKEMNFIKVPGELPDEKKKINI